MKNKPNDGLAKILLAIRKLDSSLKAEIKRGDKAIRQELLKVEERVEMIEDSQGEMNQKLDNLDSKLDGFVGSIDNLVTENVLGTNQLEDHEKRILKLEAKIQSA